MANNGGRPIYPITECLLVPDLTPVVEWSTCPHNGDHTPAPTGYLAWHEWAGRQTQAGKRQFLCPGCGLLTIWR